MTARNESAAVLQSTATAMSSALACDGCRAHAGRDGAVVLVLDPTTRVKTVRDVRVACGKRCAQAAREDGAAEFVSLATITDVLECLDRLVATYDWERGTVDRFARVLRSLRAR